MNINNREKIIRHFFNEGYSYSEIRKILETSGDNISYRQLQRILKDLGLKRKNKNENLPAIVAAIIKELEGSGSCLGYKAMWQRLRQLYGLDVYRETVLDLLRVLDPEGIELRAKYKLHTRQYRVPGPNFAWHTDGYDKLKPYGFCIHSGVDGWSRKVLWLEVATTNNKPEVIAYYFLTAVKKFKCVPSLVRSDHGTENSLIENIQMAFRWDDEDKLARFHSFIKGKSTANQRVESSWGRMRRHCIEYWIKLFKKIKCCGYFKKSNKMHLECLRFCFSHLINLDLQLTKREWNTHNIRKQKNGDVQPGKPNFLYYNPESSGARDCGFKAEEQHISNCLNTVAEKPKYCDPAFIQLVDAMFPNGVATPVNAKEATDLYFTILLELEKYN